MFARGAFHSLRRAQWRLAASQSQVLPHRALSYVAAARAGSAFQQEVQWSRGPKRSTSRLSGSLLLPPGAALSSHVPAIGDFHASRYRRFASAPDNGHDAEGGSTNELPHVIDSTLPPEQDAELLQELSEVDVGAEELGFVWKALYLPMYGVEHCLNFVHETVGLPWWGTIIASTLILRTAVLPVSVMAWRNAARMEKLKPELEAMKERVGREAQRRGLDKQAATQMYREEAQKLTKEHQVRPIRSLLVPFTQMPLFIYFFVTLRWLAREVESFSTEGALWFTDLSATDPYLRLPIIASLTFLMSLEVSFRGREMTQLQRYLKTIMRFMGLMLVPLTQGLPQAVHFYWIISNCFTTLQQWVHQNDTCRKWLGLPPSNTTLTGKEKRVFDVPDVTFTNKHEVKQVAQQKDMSDELAAAKQELAAVQKKLDENTKMTYPTGKPRNRTGRKKKGGKKGKR